MKVLEPVKKYDYWIRGGHVIDPACNIDCVADVLVTNSKFVPLPEGGRIDENDVREVIDARGNLVLPGLIDHHAHFAWNHVDIGAMPDLYEFPNGVTSACDGGSVGSSGFGALIRNTLAPSGLTMKALINVASGGLLTSQYLENIDPANFDEKGLSYLFEVYPEYIHGLKLRLGKDISDGMGVEPLRASLELAGRFEARLHLHATYPLEPMTEMIPLLRKGDVFCHSFQSMGNYNILDDGSGRVQKCVREARERGVIFECAQGRIHCSFDVAKAAIDEGFFPDVISTDLVMVSVYQKRLFSLPLVMTRMLALGMPLVEVIRACTQTPAHLMGLEGRIGTMKPGASADVCIMKVAERPVELVDSYGKTVNYDRILIPLYTLKVGRVKYCHADLFF